MRQIAGEFVEKKKTKKRKTKKNHKMMKGGRVVRSSRQKSVKGRRRGRRKIAKVHMDEKFFISNAVVVGVVVLVY